MAAAAQDYRVPVTVAPYCELLCSSIRESPLNPRKHFDERKLAELADSIRAKGVLVPLIVRETPTKFEIAAGHRRFRAAKMAGLESVPCLVRSLSDDEFLEVLTIENLQREDVHPLEEAAGFRELLKRSANDVAALAAKIGKAESYVYRRLALNLLTDEARELFWADKIGLGHAMLMCRLKEDQQCRLLADIPGLERWDGPIPVNSLRSIIRDRFHMSLDDAPFDINDRMLLVGAGSCPECQKQTGYNKCLFAEFAGDGAECTDRECWGMKLDNNFIRVLNAHPGIIQVSYQYGKKVAAPLIRAGEWRESPKGKRADTVEAVIADGHRRGTLIRIWDPQKDCAQVGEQATRENHRARVKAIEKERAIRSAVVAQIAAAKVAHGGGIEGDDLLLVLRALVDRIGNDVLAPAVKRYGIEKADGEWHCADAVMRYARGSEASGDGGDRAAALLLDLTLSYIAYVPSFVSTPDMKRPLELYEAAERYDIDFDAVEAELDEQRTAKKPKKGGKK